MNSEKLFVQADGSWVAAAAGRLVMDVMQSELEPLSHCELERRLDQAVEEHLEAELISGMEVWGKREGWSVFTQPQTGTGTITHTENSHIAENPTVQYLTSLLQKVKWSDTRRRLIGRARLSLSHTIFLSLTLLSTRLSYRAVSSRFRLEKGNVHRIFFSFCRRVNALQSRIIRWPTGPEASALLLPVSMWMGLDEKLEPEGLPKVLGVLGHTRVQIRCPPDAPHAKCPRKGSDPDSWLNVELVCDAEGRFIHCSVCPGSHRTRGEALRQRLAQNPQLLPPGTCLLAGAGYPITRHILTTFRFPQNLQEKLYNRALETHLRRLEQTTADLKERFSRLRCLDVGRTERAGAVVLTCCILHTALQDAGHTTMGQMEKHTGADDDEEDDEEEGIREEAGVRLRETVVNLLYGALGTRAQEHEEDDQHD